MQVFEVRLNHKEKLMTKNSYICNFISKHCDDNWKEMLAEKDIKVKGLGNLAIFNYDIFADFSNPLVQEARGIIINTRTCDVAAWPFRKFGNSFESYADDIDWASARVQEKIDGSIVKLWFYKEAQEWAWSSNSCIDAGEAVLSSGFSILDCIQCADGYRTLNELIAKAELNPDYTYIFELVGPMNQVVIRYDKPKLYHIGTRNNKTGEELMVDLGIDKPKEYPLHSLEDCIKAAAELNKEADYPENEGFVVVDKNWHRVKVKSPEYLIYHHTVNNGAITKERAYEILRTDDFDVDTFLKAAPDYVIEPMIYYKDRLETERAVATDAINRARDMRNSGMSRKDIALQLTGSKYSMFCFKGLDEDSSAEEIVRKYEKKLLNNINDYEIGEKL